MINKRIMHGILSFVMTMSFIFAMPSLSMAKDYLPMDVVNIHGTDSSKYVTDPDGFLNASTTNEINSSLQNFYNEESIKSAVIVLPSIGDYEAAVFAQELLQRLHLGGKDGNGKGFLILVAMESHDVHIQTSTSLSAVMPEAVALQIIKDMFVPKMKIGDIDGALKETVSEVCYQLSANSADTKGMSNSTDSSLESLLGALQQREQNKSTFEKIMGGIGKFFGDIIGTIIGTIILIILIPIVIIGLLIYWMRNKWLNWRKRNIGPKCFKCKHSMKKAEGEDFTNNLSEGQLKELELGSRDYDVWICPECGNIKINGFKGETSEYEKCPDCGLYGYRMIKKERTKEPTTRSQGEITAYYECKACGKRSEKITKIPAVGHDNESAGSGAGAKW